MLTLARLAVLLARSGLPHPDGSQRIKNASVGLSMARKGVLKAHTRLNDYLGRGIVPEDLKPYG